MNGDGGSKMVDETYIKMCRCAQEIQDNWKPKPGDMIKREWPDEPTILVRDCQYENHYWVYTNTEKGGSGLLTMDDMIKRNTVWLPRQEDLQKIYKEYFKLYDEMVILHDFELWSKSLDKPMQKLFPTIIITWLCFVMETIYKKRWNGTTWETLE